MSSNELKYPPGSDWLYLRIYGGAQALDGWLCDLRKPVNEWLDSGRINLFWHVHYLDPDYHLRLRFRLKDPLDAGLLLNRIHLSTVDLLREDLIWKMEVGTYEPEYERYGRNRISLVEEWFGVDSLYWLDVAGQNEVQAYGETWKVAIRSADAVLGDFGLTLDQKTGIITRLHENTATHLGISRDLRLRIDEKYRKLAGEVTEILNPDIRVPDPLLEWRSSATMKIDRALAGTFSDTRSLQDSNLIPDLIHMTLNRAFRTRHRMQEYLVYDFMLRYLESSRARTEQLLAAGRKNLP